MTKAEQDAKVQQLGALAVDEAVKLVNRCGCGEPRRVFIVIAYEEVGPDVWAHGTGIGHPADVVPDARALLKSALDHIVVPS